MFTAIYKFEINQPAVMVDKTKKKFYKVLILQVHLDVYVKGIDTVVTEVNYLVKITDGEHCSTNINTPESQLYADLEEAILDNNF